MRCPSCREPLDERELRCPSGHEFETVDGVLRLLDPVFTDPVLRRRGVEALGDRLRRHGIEPFVPIKGYLDLGDEERLGSLGVELRPYPQPRMRLAVLRSRLDRRRGKPCFGVWPE